MLRGWTRTRVRLDEAYSRDAISLAGTPSGETDGYRLRATGAPPPNRVGEGLEPSNATATALVTPSGIVRRYEVRYRADTSGTGDGSRVTVVDRVRFERIGSTTPGRPAWVRNATTAGDS